MKAEDKDEMLSLIEKLNHYKDMYYNKNVSEISDYEYDVMFDNLILLEDKEGIIYANSPTQSVGYEAVSSLQKIKHSHPMLSLEKTKKLEDLSEFVNNSAALLMAKMDGLTVLLTYQNGKLIQAETRGNGEEGELITYNAKTFKNIPLHIPYSGKVEIEGEAIITTRDFEKMNSSGLYKNPRNLVSGSVRQLDSAVAAKRNIQFIAWKVPFIEGMNIETYLQGFRIITEWGFTTVPWVEVSQLEDKDRIKEIIDTMLIPRIQDKCYPFDGLVIAYNNIEYGKSLGFTSHHPKHSLAYKFYDEEEQSTVRDIEWGISATGELIPVAVFDEVEIEGTTVSKASLHNVGLLKDLDIRIGDTVTVYKANQIIPQIRENLSKNPSRKEFKYLENCPYCGNKLIFDGKHLVCNNTECSGRNLLLLSRYVSKDAMDIKGLSEETIKKLVIHGFLKDIPDYYKLKDHRIEIIEFTDGIGEKMLDTILKGIEESKSRTLERLLVGLSIPMFGKTNCHELAKMSSNNLNFFIDTMNAKQGYYYLGNNIGSSSISSLTDWYEKRGKALLEILVPCLNLQVKETEQNSNGKLANLKFVVTGTLKKYTRNELKSVIESMGGQLVGQISEKVNYLICDNLNSGTTKVQKAIDLKIPVLSEKEFLNMLK